MRKVSIIIPVYNSEKYIERCISSLTGQTYRDIEIICVDDGSADRSGVILDELAKKDGRIVVLHETNGGSSAARNKGLDIASGEYIAFVDSDDHAEPEYIEVLCRNMTDDVDMVSAQANFYDESGNEIFMTEPSIDAKMTYEDPRNFMGRNRHMWVWGALFRRSLIGDLRFNVSYHMGEDTIFYFTCLRKARAVRHISERLYNYSVFEQSACHGDFSEKKYSTIYVWHDICELYADIPAVSRICRGEYGRRTFRMYNRMRKANINDKERRRLLRHIMRSNYICYLQLKGYKRKNLKEMIQYSLYMLGGDCILDAAKRKRKVLRGG